MNIARDILLFALANAMGFFAAPLIYNIAILANMFTPAAADSNPAYFQTMFFSGTMITWVACALFSLGFFIVKGKARLVFVAAPALIPLFYGLSVLLEFSSERTPLPL